MGNNCVRDCERSQEARSEVNPQAASGAGNSVPGFSAGGSGGWPDASVIKVGQVFDSPTAAIASSQPSSGGASGQSPGQPHTPRVVTPLNLGAAAGAVQDSPRPSESSSTFASPRPGESPRPPEEGKAEVEAQLDGGQLYQGQWQGNKKHGVGRLEIVEGPSRARYEGEFFEDLKHGHGVLTWQDGRQYRGQFIRGKFHGEAVMTWPDGRRYVGQYADDRKHGSGTFSWQDGRRYEGQWVMGKRHGTGVYTNAKAITRQGTWNMDRPLRWEPDDIKSESPEATRGEACRV